MIILEIKVIPSSGMSKIVLDKGQTIKCYLKSQPEDGKANKELLILLAEKLSIPRACIDIVSGLTSRKKRIKIDRPLTLQEIYHTLGFEIQNTFPL